MHANKKFSLKFFQLLLLPVAIFIDTRYQKYEKVYMFVYYCVILMPIALMECILFFQQTFFIYKVDILMSIFNTYIISYNLQVIHKKRHLFVHLYDSIATNELLDDTFFDQFQASLMENFKFWATFFSFLTLLSILIPVQVALFTDAELGTLPTLFFPFLLPWASNTAAMYSCTMLLQMVMGAIPLCVIVAVIFLSLYFKVLATTMCQYTKRNIQMWDQNNRKRRHLVHVSSWGSCSTKPTLECPQELLQIFHLHQFLKK